MNKAAWSTLQIHLNYRLHQRLSQFGVYFLIIGRTTIIIHNPMEIW